MNPVFFTDRDLGKGFPNTLRAAGLSVERHQDHFSQDCPDEVWLEEIGKRGWIAVTHDGRIRYKPNERAAVVKHRVGLLVMIGHATHPELAAAFVTTTQRILRFLETHDRPFIAKVYRPNPKETALSADAPGRVELWYPQK